MYAYIFTEITKKKATLAAFVEKYYCTNFIISILIKYTNKYRTLDHIRSKKKIKFLWTRSITIFFIFIRSYIRNYEYIDKQFDKYLYKVFMKMKFCSFHVNTLSKWLNMHNIYS